MGKAATPGVTTERLTVDGATRAYLRSIPDSYDPSTRAPLILNFHGLGSNKEQQALYMGMNQKAGATGYVVITPDGTGTTCGTGASRPSRVGARRRLREGAARHDARRSASTRSRVRDRDVERRDLRDALGVCLPGRFAHRAVGGERDQGLRPRTPPPRCSRSTAPPIRSCRTPAAGTSPASTRSTRPGTLRHSPRAAGQRRGRGWAAFDGCGTPATTTAVAAGVEHIAYPECPAGGDRRALPGRRRRPHVAGASRSTRRGWARRPRRSTPPA